MQINWNNVRMRSFKSAALSQLPWPRCGLQAKTIAQPWVKTITPTPQNRQTVIAGEKSSAKRIKLRRREKHSNEIVQAEPASINRWSIFTRNFKILTQIYWSLLKNENKQRKAASISWISNTATATKWTNSTPLLQLRLTTELQQLRAGDSGCSFSVILI